MRFHGKVYKDSQFWLVEVPILNTMTQGRTRKGALAMVKDLLETLATIHNTLSNSGVLWHDVALAGGTLSYL